MDVFEVREDARAAVAHPVHHLPQSGAGGRREVVPYVLQVMKVQFT
jgi:hypothetical protein